MRPALPASDYYDGSATSHRHQPTLRLAPTGRATGRFPRSLPVGRRDRCPAFSLRPCRDDHAATRRGPPVARDRCHQQSGSHEVLGTPRTASPAHIHRVRAGWILEGVRSPIHFRCTAPPCLPGPRDPTVLTRPSVVGAAFRPRPQLQTQTAPSFHRPLRRPIGEVSHPARHDSASWRTTSSSISVLSTPRPTPTLNASSPSFAALTNSPSAACTSAEARVQRWRPAPALRSSWRFSSSRWTCSHSPRSQRDRTRREDRHLRSSTDAGTTSKRAIMSHTAIGDLSRSG